MLMSSGPSVGRLQIARASGAVVLGKYRVFASLGRGGMAEVQLAAIQGPKGFNKLVVVKRLRPLLADDAAVVNMFLDEARLAARLNHPNVIHTYEFGEESGTFFLVMEFLEGRPLSEVLNACRTRAGDAVSPGLWAKIVSEGLAGLHYAHELRDYDGTPLGIVHRDVSPQNIVVTYDGGVKLVDFGIAKAAVNANKTESQIIKGKLAYMAPEQADPVEGQDIDRRADVFSMGIVLWECLTGKRLAPGDGAREVLAKILNAKIAAPSTINPAVPPDLDAITLRALQREPADRFQTALAMRDALERFLHTQRELVDDTAIGALVCEHFGRERDDIQRQIRVQMLEIGTVTTSGLTVADSTPSQRVARRKLLEAIAPADGGPAESPAVQQHESAGSLRAVRTSVRADGRRPSPRWLAVAGLAALAVFGTALAMRPGVRRAPARAPVDPTTTAAAAPGSPVVSAAESASPAPVSSPPASASSESQTAPAASKSLVPPRAAPARSSGRPPKLEDDPWR